MYFTDDGRESRRKDHGDPRAGVKKPNLLFREAPLWPLLLTVIVVVPVTSWVFYFVGEKEGRRLADQAAVHEDTQLPPEVSTELEEALTLLRKGESDEALNRLKKLGGYPSLAYLTALAAMQSGAIDLAEEKVRESISRRERISDALALQSLLEVQKAADPTRLKMGDSRVRAEQLLRQAILADPANPYPHFELSARLRESGRQEEGIKEIRAAQARLNPMDSHIVIDVTLAIMEIENLPADRLPAAAPASGDIRELFPAAYAALRRGDLETAATLLQKCRQLTSPDLFGYLVNDPAIRKYSHEPRLTEFFAR